MSVSGVLVQCMYWYNVIVSLVACNQNLLWSIRDYTDTPLSIGVNVCQDIELQKHKIQKQKYKNKIQKYTKMQKYT